MRKREKALNIFLVLGFITYIIFLAWNILFKYVSPLELFNPEYSILRNVNFVPYMDILNNDFNTNMFNIIILFIPFGMFLCIYAHDTKALLKILTIVCISISFEAIKFISGIGGSDIMNIIYSIIGGFIGILIYQVLKSVFKDDNKIKIFMAVFISIVVVIAIFLLISLNLTT